MAKSHFSSTIAQLLLLAISVFCLHTTDGQTGACYGTLGDNLPTATEVIQLCKQHNITRMRLYNPNPSVLEALNNNPDVSVIVGVANEDIIGIAQDTALAQSWVQEHILKYENINFRYIAVGNEISPSDCAGSSIAPSVPPAMQNIYNALTAAGLGNVKVSTALSMGVLAQSYPPSTGEFHSEMMDEFIDPIVKFLAKTEGPYLANVYPYFAYISDTTNIELEYAIFTSTNLSVVKDGQYEYQNLFDAMVDAIHAALEKAGGENVEVVVSESGWSSGGGTETNIDNAKAYNSNLIESVKKGTPRRPGKALEAYIFDLIDENQKSPEVENHWGLFLPNKEPKYPITFS